MISIVNKTILFLALSTPFFMVANILGGILLAEFEGEFDIDIFKKSMVKYIGLLAMAALIFVGGRLANDSINEILSVDLHIDELLLVGIATFSFSYAIQAIGKFKELSGVNMREEL